MRLIVAFSLFILIGTIGQASFAQDEPKVDGGKYVLHTVAHKETIFSLCQRYHITLKELEAANPGLGGVLQAGSTVKIPVAPTAQEVQQKQIDSEFYYHKVQKQQTLFSIAKQYGITENDIIRFNPTVAQGLKVGQILKIPVKPSESEKKSTPEQTVNTAPERGFILHQVVSGETLFSLEKQYGISDEEMMRLNPELKNGLKTGMKLKIPEKAESLKQSVAEPTQSTGSKYQVEKGETIFSIASRFGVDVSDLKKANPALYTRSVQAGETIQIPEQTKPAQATPSTSDFKSVQQPASAFQDIPVNCMPQANAGLKKYKVALLLPLYLTNDTKIAQDDAMQTGNQNQSSLFSPIFFNNHSLAISTDTTIVAGGTRIDPRATGFMEFYEGAVLALDSLRRVGMNVELYVLDANNPKQVSALIQKQEFLDMNLIIGPVYPDLQAIVAPFAAKNRIPMVSPLSSDGNIEQNNSWYFKAVPSRDFQIDQTAKYISDEFRNRNFILIRESGVNPSSPEARLGQLCRQNLAGGAGRNLFHEYDFQSKGVTDINGLLDLAGENIFVVPSNNEAQVSVAVSNLNALAGKYNIVLMGTSAFTKMKSIQTENYHHVRLRYLSPYYTDYKKPAVRRFVGHYRDIFNGEPTQFSFQGYDVTFYFMSALYRYGTDFRGCLPSFPMQLTQMNFDFRKVAPMGGYVNESLFVTSYERNFDILNFGTFRPQP